METGAARQDDTIPLIEDETVYITPEMAQEMLRKNKHNRPIAWRKVEEYSSLMQAGSWKLHAQGIVLDENGNILTGQKRLWAIVYADTPIYMRVSRGNPSDVAHLLDRGNPQSARDLASRATERKHSPMESSIARAALAMFGDVRPSKDTLAHKIVALSDNAQRVLSANRGKKKTRTVLMIMGALCSEAMSVDLVAAMAKQTIEMADELEMALSPHKSSECWGKGAAFGLAMEKARGIVVSAIAKNVGEVIGKSV